MKPHPEITTSNLTIGRLALAANVGIETIRYYQQKRLLPIPKVVTGAFRYYPIEMTDRIRFIKRAQELGFTLDEVSTLLALEDCANRAAIRKVASDRLTQIRAKVDDLTRMENALSHLINECEAHGRAKKCPIIAALSDANPLSKPDTKSR